MRRSGVFPMMETVLPRMSYATIAAEDMLRKGAKLYHISDDKRARKSASLITEDLMHALESKSFTEISITDVCALHGVARTTFYRLFDTVDDVLVLQFDALFARSLHLFETASREGASFARVILRIAMSDKTLVRAIIASGRSDLFSSSTAKVEGLITQSVGISMDARDMALCNAMLTQFAFIMLKEWVESDCNQSVDEVYALMKREMTFLYENI